MADAEQSLSVSQEHRSKLSAVRLLFLLTAVTTMVGFLHGLLQSLYIAYLREHASFSDLYPALVQTAWKGAGYLFLLTQSVFVYAVFALYRCTLGTPLARPALVSLLVFALDVSFSWSYHISPELLQQVFASRVGGLVNALLLLIGYGLLFATLARLTARPFDRLMSAALGLYVLLNLTSILLAFLPAAYSLGSSAWGFFVIRQPIVIAFRGVTIYVLWRALQDLQLMTSTETTASSAAAPVGSEAEAAPSAVQQSGQRLIMLGTLWLLGGLIVTAASYQLASSSGGGRFVMAYGAVIYGIVQIIRGLMRSGE